MRRNLAMGIGFGLFVATALTVWASVLRLLAEPGLFAELNATYRQVVIGYYLGGLTGGFLMGLAWPLRRWLTGYLVLGVLGTFPMYLFAPGNWTQLFASSGAAILPSLVAAAFVGGAAGIWAWSDDHPEGPHRFDALRYPTGFTACGVWAVAVLLTGSSWYLVPKWSAGWPFGLVVVGAGLSVVLPIMMAVLVTMRWRDRRREHQDATR